MRAQHILIILALVFCTVGVSYAQAQKALTNADIVNMTKQGLEASLIVQEVQSSSTDFDTSPQALIDLKSAGVDHSVMQAMLTVQAKKPTGTVDAVRSTALTAEGVADSGKPVCGANTGCLLREGTLVPLKFAVALSSKTADDGDPVEFVLDDDLKVGESIVVSKGAHAVATVSNAKKAGMMGRPGDLSVKLEYLAAGSTHMGIRGTKGRQGDSKTGATVALVVLFGPIGLIKHGKNVEIAAGTPFTAYVDQDIWLTPIR